MIACHECDALQQLSMPAGLRAKARCYRCEALLATADGRSTETTLGLAVTGVVVLIIANAFPLASLRANGVHASTTLATMGSAMWASALSPVAILVLATTIAAPATELLATAAMLWIVRREPTPGKGQVPAYLGPILRTIQTVRHWSMLDVFIVGALVTIVKLHAFAEVSLGAAMFAVGVAMLIMTKITTSFDAHAIWLAISHTGSANVTGNDQPGPAGGAAVSKPDHPHADTPRSLIDGSIGPSTALQAGLMNCEACALLTPGQLGATTVTSSPRCPRCSSRLHSRKPASLERTWAFLITAAVLAVPANLLPITHSRTALGDHSDTIFSGVVYFFESGSWGIALIVLIASVVVPLLKLGILASLAWSVRRGKLTRPRRSTRLYRFVEFIGRWSMLDVFVVALMTALVQLGGLATIDAGPAVLAFAMMCIVTILASRAFDPRLLWDGAKDEAMEARP